MKIEHLGSSNAITEALERRWPRSRKISSEMVRYVQSIVEDVRKRGDDALVDFTLKFDGICLSPQHLRVNQRETEDAYAKVTNEQISAIKSAKDRVEILEKRLLERLNFEDEFEGTMIRTCTYPVGSVGCYVPGGEAAYPSTVVMTTIPAKIAGVSRVVVCSPPRSVGEINPLTLVAADICRVDEVFKVGGAQAIAALAYGTKSIRPVEKIVGPGNRYVTSAKMLVEDEVPIDLPAGPSEVVILADESADPHLVTLDMISQLEHGADAIAILVTPCRNLADETAREFEMMTGSLPGMDKMQKSISTNRLVVISENMDEAIDFVNEFAPEHVQVMTQDTSRVVQKIKSAGLILVGPYTPVSASDYCLGTNHVLPTGGFARASSGLSVLDFVRRVRIVECSKEGLSQVRRSVKVLAESEGLMNHARAVEGRFKNE